MAVKIDAELTEKLRECAQKMEKKSRYEHSLRVAETAKEMCEIYGVDSTKGYFAGISHDLCKDIDEALMVEYAKRDGLPLSEAEKSKTFLLHGRAAAVMLSEKFGVEDSEVLQAVACHTLGNDKMCDLAKIVYVADKIEPARPQSTEEYRKRLFAMPIDDMTLLVLQESFDYLLSKGKTPAYESVLFMESLKVSEKRR